MPRSQGFLFGTSPLGGLSLAQFRKSVFAIHMFPINGSRLTAQARKLHTVLGNLSSQQFARLAPEQREDIAHTTRQYVQWFRDKGGKSRREIEPPFVVKQPRFAASLQELATVSGYTVSNARQLVPHLELLASAQLRFNVFGHSAQIDDLSGFPAEMPVVSSAVSSIARGRYSMVSWGYDPLLFLVMTAPRTYAKISMSVLQECRTYSAIALYENVVRFIAIGRAGPYPFDTWRQLLSEEGSSQDWSDSFAFKRKIQKSIAELDQCGSDIWIEPKEVWVPDHGNQLQFLVRPKVQTASVTVSAGQGAHRALQALTSIGFTKAGAAKVLAAYDDEYIFATLELLQQSKAKETQSIQSEASWVSAALKSGWAYGGNRQAPLARTKPSDATRLRESPQTQRPLPEPEGAYATARAWERYLQMQAFEQDIIFERFQASEEGQRAIRLLGGLDSKGGQASFKAWLASNL